MSISQEPLTSTDFERLQEKDQVLLSEKAYRQIKHKIATLALPPSSLINEQELREELGIGRTPIRDALRRLEVENLVTIIPRRGTFVSDLSITNLQALAEIRVELEGLAARLAAGRIDDEQLAHMEALFEGFDEVIVEGGNKALMNCDKQFHYLVYEAADNEFMEDVLDQLYTLSLRLWYLVLDRLDQEVVKEAIGEHLKIIEAFGERDGARAEKEMQRHVVGFQKQMRAEL